MPRKRQRYDDSPPPESDSNEEGEVNTRLIRPVWTVERLEEKKERRRQRRKDRKKAKKQAERTSGASSTVPPNTDDEQPDPDEQLDTDEAQMDSDEVQMGNEQPALNEDDIQRKYFQPYQLASMSREEDRPMFDMREPEIRVKPVVRTVSKAVLSKICLVCTTVGHADSACPELLCVYCGEHNKHFSKACLALRPQQSEPTEWWGRGSPPPGWDKIVLNKPTAPYDWRSEARREHPEKHRTIRAYCYHCAGVDHYGYDCPDIPASRRGQPGSFSGFYALEYVDPHDDSCLSKYSRTTKSLKVSKTEFYGRAALRKGMRPLFDPFREYQQSAEARRHQPPPPYHSQLPPNRGGRQNGTFRSRDNYHGGGGGNGRDTNRDSYRPMPSAAAAGWRQLRR